MQLSRLEDNKGKFNNDVDEDVHAHKDQDDEEEVDEDNKVNLNNNVDEDVDACAHHNEEEEDVDKDTDYPSASASNVRKASRASLTCQSTIVLLHKTWRMILILLPCTRSLSLACPQFFQETMQQAM
jgi:hypothetical protein